MEMLNEPEPSCAATEEERRRASRGKVQVASERSMPVGSSSQWCLVSVGLTNVMVVHRTMILGDETPLERHGVVGE